MNVSLFVREIKSFFKSMTRQQSVVFFSSLAILFIALILVAIIGSNVQYSPLFTGLNSKSAGEVVSYLEQHKIQYRVIAGNIIEVPKDEVYRLRLQLAASNTPNSGVVGFDIFNHQGFGVTNFVENVNYLRALEGELVKTIESINVIKSARVNLAIPKPSIFTEEQKPSKASVLLTLYEPISHSTVIAIQKLVASSVPNLGYNNVTVVDSEGHLLSVKRGGNAMLASNEVSYKNEVESDYKNKIKQMLSPILGNSNFVVGVNVSLNLSRTKIISVSYNPNSVVVSEEQKKTKSTSPIQGGTPGVVSNIAKSPASNKTSKAISTESKTVTNFDVGQTKTQTIEPYMKIKRISVAVIVDGTYQPIKNKNGGVVHYKYTPRSPSEIALIKSAVENAIGYNKDRDDSISVVSMPFRQQPVIQKKKNVREIVTNIITTNPLVYKYLIAAILLALFYFVFMRKFLKNVLKKNQLRIERVEKEERYTTEKIHGKSVKDIEKEIAMELDSEIPVNEDNIKGKVMEDKIKDVVNVNPEEAAKIIKGMLSTKQK